MALKHFSINSFIQNVTIFLLICVGIIAVYSSTFTAVTETEGQGKIYNQLIFVILGIFIYILLSKINYTYLKHIQILILIYVFQLALLLYVLFFTEQIGETNRWISLGFINIQPAEYAKITLLIVNAYIFTIPKLSIERIARRIALLPRLLKLPQLISEKIYESISLDLIKFVISAIFNIPIIVLVYMQPSLGNTLIITFIWIFQFFMSVKSQFKYIAVLLIMLLGGNLILGIINKFPDYLNFTVLNFEINSYLAVVSIIITLIISRIAKIRMMTAIIILLLGVATTLIVTSYWENGVKDYQKERVESFVSSCKTVEEIRGDCWQVRQSQIAIGSGKITGKGYLHGSQSKLKYLPFAYTDFIFASLSEEFGFVGAMFLLFLYFVLLINLLLFVNVSKTKFGSILVFGVFFMFLVHIVVNVGMNIGLLPVTGIPLPLVSYGGSSVLANLIALALVQGIMRRDSLVDTSGSRMIVLGGLFGIKSY